MNLPAVTTSQLEYFVAALDAPTWRDAASRVGVSPSALSQGIAELERRLGIRLFDRDGRRRVPTTAAAQVRRHAERLLGELRELDRFAEQVRGGTVGELSIGMIDTAAIHHFGDVLVGFRRQHPGVTLRLFVQPSNQLLDLVRSGEIDAAVVVDPDLDDRLDRRPILDEPLHVYAPPGTAVGHPSTWGPWVGFPVSSRTRSITARRLRDRGVDYDVVAESSQPAVLREMVQLGMGWCVLPRTDAEVEPHSLTRAVDDPLAERTLTLVLRRDRDLSPALEQLLDQLFAAVPR